MPAHTGPRLASVSACWLCGHCFFPALLFSAEPVLEGRDLNPQSLHHLHPNAALAMNISSLSACTAFAKLWGMLSAAPQSVQFQDSVPIPGTMALRSAGGSIHPLPLEQPWEVGETSVRQGQQLPGEEAGTAHYKMPTVDVTSSPFRLRFLCSCA